MTACNSMVTVIVPVFNEESYLPQFHACLDQQDYPSEMIEVLFVEGGSADRSVDILNEYVHRRANSRILHNPKRTAPCAMNNGIKEATGDIIVRMDVHTWYPAEYLFTCISYLNKTDADNVGCPCVIQGKGMIGHSIESVITSSFGVGKSSWRKGNEYYSDKSLTEYVDTVPFGTFRKELFDKIGLFDERYPRAEDNDFNYRIRNAGGKILLFKDIFTVYYCRGTVQELIHMGYGNGYSGGAILHKNPEIMGIKYYIPLLFVLSLIVGILNLVFQWSSFIHFLFILELIVYGTCCVFFAAKTKGAFVQKVVTGLLFPLFHISYGIGTLMGLLSNNK